MPLTILARKPRTPADAAPVSPVEIILVDRGGRRDFGRYVTAVANADSLARDEWWWGHYCDTLAEATRDFNDRK